MTREQDRIVRRFERLISDAKAVGLMVAVDCDAVAIRLIPTEEASADDIRSVGTTVPVHNACGSRPAKVSGNACNFGNL